MKSKPKLSDIFDEAFKKVAQGRKPSEIIRLTGMPSATVYQKLKKFGLWHKGVHNQAHKNSIRKMRSENPRISVTKMSNILGLPYSTTHTYAVELEEEEIAKRIKVAEERTKRVSKRKAKTPVAKVVKEEPATVNDAVDDESLEFIAEEAVGDETVVEETVVEETVGVEAVFDETVGVETVVQEMIGDETVIEETVGGETVVEEMVGCETVVQETVSDVTVAQETIVELAVVEEFIVKGEAVAESPEKLKERQEEASIEELETVGEMLWTTEIDWAAAAEAEGEHP